MGCSSVFQFFCVTVATLIVGSAANAEAKYVLIDNSGSMAAESRRAAVESLVEEEISTTPLDSALSITVFNGPEADELQANGEACEADVVLSPSLADEQARENFQIPAASGSTPLLSAVNALSEAKILEPTTAVLITDGSYTCGEIAEICGAFRSTVNQHSHLRWRVHLVDANPAAFDEFSCVQSVWSAQVQSLNSPKRTARTDRNDLLALRLFGFSTFSFLALLAACMSYWARTTKETLEADADKGETADRKPSPGERVLIFFVVVTGGFAGWSLRENWNEIHNAWISLVFFSNSQFGSRVIPTALFGVIGWIFVQLWGVANERRQKAWKDKIQKQQEAVARHLRLSEQGRLRRSISELAIETERLQKQETEDWFADKNDLEPELVTKIERVLNCVHEVRAVLQARIVERVEQALTNDLEEPEDAPTPETKPNTEKPLDAELYIKMFEWSPKRLAKQLRTVSIIEPTQEESVREFFEIWASLQKSRPIMDAADTERLQSFNKFTLEFPPPVSA